MKVKVTKSMFDENGKYKPDGLELDGIVSRILGPIIEKYVSEGYSPREIEYIINHAAMEHCLFAVI